MSYPEIMADLSTLTPMCISILLLILLNFLSIFKI